MAPNTEGLARLLLRSEGLASSFIEGITAPVVEVIVAEEHPSNVATTPAWVAANLAAVDEALSEAYTDVLTLDGLCRWHSTLMAGSPTPAKYIGCLRTEQGWIGGTSPLDARLVTPPPEFVADLIEDCLEFANRSNIDAITQAAVAHAQFEIIHPFADGNGRIGRLLVLWILTRRLSLVTPPPVSAGIARDVGGYGAGLALFRLGDHNAWIRWFADVVSNAGRMQQELVISVERLQAQWRERLGASEAGARRVRADSAAWRVLDVLPRHLLLSAPHVAKVLGIPPKSAAAALQLLASVGILTEHDHLPSEGRPRRLFVCPELLGLVGSSPLR